MTPEQKEAFLEGVRGIKDNDLYEQLLETYQRVLLITERRKTFKKMFNGRKVGSYAEHAQPPETN